MNGEPSQCDPMGDGPKKGPCCSASGFCGNTDKHCNCPTCKVFESINEESSDIVEEKDSNNEEVFGDDFSAACKKDKEMGSVQDNKYCDLDCTHTMCRYKVKVF